MEGESGRFYEKYKKSVIIQIFILVIIRAVIAHAHLNQTMPQSGKEKCLVPPHTTTYEGILKSHIPCFT